MTGDPKNNKTIGHSLSLSQQKEQLSSTSFDEEDYFLMNPHDEQQSHKYNQINQFGSSLQIHTSFEKNNQRTTKNRFPFFSKFYSAISRGSVTSDTGTSSSSEVDDLFREEFGEFKEEEEDPPISLKKVRMSVKVSAKQARRLKRIAKFHPESLRKIGLKMLKVNEEESIHISDSLMSFGKPEEDVNIPKQVQLDEQIPENFEQPFSFQVQKDQSSGATEITTKEFLEKDPLIGSCYVRKPKPLQKPNHVDETINSVLETVLGKGNHKIMMTPWFSPLVKHRQFSTRKRVPKQIQFQPISLPIDQNKSIDPQEQGPMILMNSLKPIIHQLPVGQVLHLTHHETQESIGRVFIQPKRRVIRKPPQKFLKPIMTVTLQEPPSFKKAVTEEKSTPEEEEEGTDVQTLIANIKADTNRKLDEKFLQRWTPKPLESQFIQQSPHLKNLKHDQTEQVPASERSESPLQIL
ncbi:hypothetical protein CAEBREN_03330 [Caenorhabditis brenneri]|uniref:Uncharacterized protein n=1 Tax=Caenorhabditis brenneri TaxID=135651 RepID=G0P185_CAEBE|nr:hypothetical protein CAEBREN_03330 [Caenorhabditis brenneri]